ncbi:oxygen-dependent tRNA uridine(34) hydroxylase TrhO [Cardinium endosymbiont of Oedothorax gibbosus]|uniref:oxygen-dependent tRNA uridine(34) hydroxylase TrhO n=1 Tax=Cardinium endosymbiont of Oedothorax gibbosus TaxID=931101 RepID=UPI002024ECD1|nr:rhodanese-like domain-containing protein [Cardinium endosymbiont of Oedothorax gibbosus]CAH2560223.1 tRNA uridine(34) hydroxylase [Cardinium endosymbiont of Oedothorax gibbosus]
MFKVATLYKFVPLDDLVALQKKLQSICKALTGTLLIASEGINGTIAGLPDLLDDAIAQIEAIPSFGDLWYQYSKANHKPFRLLKVRIKKEIIAMHQPEVPSMLRRGHCVLASDWNNRMDQSAVVIDVRNDYEHRLGSFEGALNPKTTYFSQFPAFVEQNLTPYKDQPIAMFCTGGIRCEKASAYMLSSGFKEVYQLSGGILQYLAHTQEALSRWKGECFVFDERISLGHGLKKGSSLLCYGCRMPLTTEDLDENYQSGIRCKFCLKDK